ncbi:MAG: BamA/TamA family outer membrane protein [Ignavibacteriaceae bacterium]|nr:BamA/TamA family outer membrane protein [Ignavibacteriaceae bacterium]
MYRGLISTSLFLISFHLLILSQPKPRVDFSGNYFFDKNELLSATSAIPADNFIKWADSLTSVVARLYFDNGFLDCDLTRETEFLNDTIPVLLKLNIKEGDRYSIKVVNIAGDDSSFSGSTGELTRKLEGSDFSSLSLQKYIAELIELYENSGHPFIKVVVESVVRDTSEEQSLFVNIRIEKGAPYNIDRIVIKGNENTADYVIIREIDLVPGEKFSEQKINSIPLKLNRLRFFDPVQIPDYYLDSRGQGVLEIKVVERKVNNFDGIVGFIPPSNDEEKGYFTGLVTVSIKNLFGTGRGTLLRWQKIDRLSNELEFNYYEPRVFGFRLNAGGGFFQKKQDSIYIQNKVDLFAEFPATDEIFFLLQFSRESLIPSILEVPIFTVYNSDQNTFSAGLKIDTRDDPLSPTKGSFFQTTFGSSQKGINGPAEYLTPEMPREYFIKRITLNLNLFYSLFPRQVAMLGINGKHIEGGLVEVSDLYKFGGTRSLRGYRENQFFGSVIGWSNFEYRFLLTRRSFAFLFYDLGFYKRDRNDKLKITGAEEAKSGYGFGLNLETGVGVLNVSYALAKGETFNQGKIHFGIINDF